MYPDEVKVVKLIRTDEEQDPTKLNSTCNIDRNADLSLNIQGVTEKGYVIFAYKNNK